MFSGFTDETVRFFLDLKFNNNTAFFHENHDRYVEEVQRPFYEFIEELAPAVKTVDDEMEIRPYKCLSRIHRDTRFTRDKSPYRDHLWLLFRRAAEPREKSLFYFFEFGVNRLDWGMGFWGENRPAMDSFRRRTAADPDTMLSVINKIDLQGRGLFLGGSRYKRIAVPDGLPTELISWYTVKELYIGKNRPDYQSAFLPAVADEVRTDFLALAPLYRVLRGCADESSDK